MDRRASRLYEFSSDSSAITCLSIGRKSGRVLVTGGEDRRVNLWAIGKPQAIMSLVGHTSPIESVTLDWPEEIAVAGAGNGSIKLWDLDHSKVIRTLTGHKPTFRVGALEFHPFGEFFASGSADATCKIWDVRRKGCIQTYHNDDAISVLRISPDGRWIACGGMSGTVKIWDMTAGRLLRNFCDHVLSVTSLSFNPAEFSMASLSIDQTLRVYDLTNFESIGVGRVEGKPGLLEFSGSGSTMLVATSTGVQTWALDPTLPLGRISIPWDTTSVPVSPGISTGTRPSHPTNPQTLPIAPVADMKIVSDGNGLVAATLRHNSVSVWNVDLSERVPIGEWRDGETGVDLNPENRTSVLAKSFSLRADTVKIKEVDSSKGGYDPDGVVGEERVGHQTSAKRRESGWRTQIYSNSREPMRPQALEVGEQMVGDPFDNTSSEMTAEPQIISHENPDLLSSAPPPKNSLVPEPARFEHSRKELSSTRSTSASSNPQQNTFDSAVPPSSHAQANDVEEHGPWTDTSTLALRALSESRESTSKMRTHVLLMKEDENEPQASDSRLELQMSSLDIFDALEYRHHSILATLTNRLSTLRLISQQWDVQNYGPAVETAARDADLATWRDIENAIVMNPQGLNLDTCSNILPAVVAGLREPGDEFIATACEITKVLVRNFGQVIVSNINSGVQRSPGVDLNREKRVERCTRCYRHFRDTATALTQRLEQGVGGSRVEETLREIYEYFSFV
ncbi:WD40 repeat-like protein [Gonapodya prolifera JEL478]|uniref:Katanin p80 WD40 repeat-containing subunit B1 homolog n=1 Tax=Gonapodya prolifera (strain JEL478) TaxID=1344416 RepID=A0A139AEY9_GONPJ|nr:WD40 repeat-like protein [Gonapodya prolifera JEL478]|eukprot:KXS15134.1 WD40 repeat-like protein [Gonapodya prolifera JEL478]